MLNEKYLELAHSGVVRVREWKLKVVPWGTGFVLEVTSPRNRRTQLWDTYREGRAGMGQVHLIAQAAVRRLLHKKAYQRAEAHDDQ
jgi:hypothetical protein